MEADGAGLGTPTAASDSRLDETDRPTTLAPMAADGNRLGLDAGCCGWSGSSGTSEVAAPGPTVAIGALATGIFRSLEAVPSDARTATKTPMAAASVARLTMAAARGHREGRRSPLSGGFVANVAARAASVDGMSGVIAFAEPAASGRGRALARCGGAPLR